MYPEVVCQVGVGLYHDTSIIKCLSCVYFLINSEFFPLVIFIYFVIKLCSLLSKLSVRQL